MSTDRSFEKLIDEGSAVDVTGWDFSWFEGRATEGRPPWAYQRRVAERLRQVRDVVDIQTGGGEVIAGALRISGVRPRAVSATESWEPNLALARRALAPWNATVYRCPDDAVPLPAASVDLAVSRHPVTTAWDEIARVLRPGATYLSQEVGHGSMRELTEAMIGPFPVEGREPEVAAGRARAAALDVIELRTASLPMAFHDVAAVVVFLRKVIWIVPDFTVDAYLPQLREVHDRIQATGPFRATSERFLIECRKPA